MKAGRLRAKKEAPKVPLLNEHLRPLRRRESLWDMQIHPNRFNNILGGWVGYEEKQKSKGSKRDKNTKDENTKDKNMKKENKGQKSKERKRHKEVKRNNKKQKKQAWSTSKPKVVSLSGMLAPLRHR